MSSKARRESRSLRLTAQDTIDTAGAPIANTQEHRLATGDTAVQAQHATLPNDISEIDLLTMIWEKMSRMERTENNIDDKLNTVIDKVKNRESAQNVLRADVSKIEESVQVDSISIDANKTDLLRTVTLERDISAMKNV